MNPEDIVEGAVVRDEYGLTYEITWVEQDPVEAEDLLDVGVDLMPLEPNPISLSAQALLDEFTR